MTNDSVVNLYCHFLFKHPVVGMVVTALLIAGAAWFLGVVTSVRN